MAIALLLVYSVWPIVVHFIFHPDPYFVRLASIAFVAAIFVILGFQLPIFDRQFGPKATHLTIPERALHIPMWTIFLVFFVVTVATAPAIPFLTALTGAHEHLLSEQRGAFLTGRKGWESALVYVAAVLTSALLPYSLCRLIILRSKMSVPAGLVLLSFMVSFLAKAMFLQIAIPLATLAGLRKRYLLVVLVILGSVCLIGFNTYIQKAGRQQAEAAAQKSVVEGLKELQGSPRASGAKIQLPAPGPYFSSAFTTASAMEHIIWRIFAVPVFTASDTLRVFDDKFEGRYLLGATSSAVSAIFGLKRVNLDSEVFAYQWGASEIGRSNAAFITDAFANFGWFGVIFFSLFVGQSLRWFHLSHDDAFRALWPLYVYFVAQGSLIGTLLSNGFALLFLIGLFVRLRSKTE